VIYHNVALSKPEGARLRRLLKVLREGDTLPGRHKFITKPNLLRIFALRGLEDLEQGGSEDETVDLLVRFGRAKGRPDGRR
jgi:hypothetical protein